MTNKTKVHPGSSARTRPSAAPAGGESPVAPVPTDHPTQDGRPEAPAVERTFKNSSVPLKMYMAAGRSIIRAEARLDLAVAQRDRLMGLLREMKRVYRLERSVANQARRTAEGERDIARADAKNLVAGMDEVRAAFAEYDISFGSLVERVHKLAARSTHAVEAERTAQTEVAALQDHNAALTDVMEGGKSRAEWMEEIRQARIKQGEAELKANRYMYQLEQLREQYKREHGTEAPTVPDSITES